MRALLAIFFFAVLLPITSHANDWSHIHLKSADGLAINIDYIVNRHASIPTPMRAFNAAPLYVNVSGPGLSGQEHVRIVMNNHQVIPFVGGRAGSDPVTYTMDLEWQDTHYSGEINGAKVSQSFPSIYSALPMTVFLDGRSGTFRFEQDISVVVDGRWLVDPVSENTLFRFNLFDGAQTVVLVP